MLKYFLTGSSISILLLTGSLAAQAEPPRPESQFSSQSNALPSYSQNALLRKYTATDSVPVLKLGDRGQAVADVQQYLKQAGLYTGAVDGVYGEASQAAVAQFQELADIRIDGVVGIETWKAIITK
jgi:peptidoglycan hydrolase-like protein with peptidoglycan-binding domain